MLGDEATKAVACRWKWRRRLKRLLIRYDEPRTSSDKLGGDRRQSAEFSS